MRWVPRSIAPSSVATEVSTKSPSCRYFGFLACFLKKSLHLSAGGSRAADDLDRLGRGAECGADRGAGEQQVAGVEGWNRAQGLQRLERAVDHVAPHDRVLADLAVDPQQQAQVGETRELALLEQDQLGPTGVNVG